MEYINCVLCGCESYVPLYQIPDYLLGRPEVQARFVKCTSCGLIYQNPRPTLEEMMAHYPPEYEPYQIGGQAQEGGAIARAIQYGMDKRCRYITERFPNGGRLLDIGCSTGEFLHAMRQKGRWDVYGIEPNAIAAKVARERYGLSVFEGYMEESPFPPNSFQAVTMWDVLEHLHDPVQALTQIHKLLTSSGLLVIRVPNYASWDARLFGPYWAGLDAPRHLYVFSPKTLSDLLRKTGFNVLDYKTNIGRYPTFVLSVRFVMRAKRISPAWQQRISRWLYSPLARVLSVPVFWLYGAGIRGPLMVVRAYRR